MRDWTEAEAEAYDDFMDSWANSHLCETQDETLGSEKPVVEFKIVELHAVDPFFP